MSGEGVVDTNKIIVFQKFKNTLKHMYTENPHLTFPVLSPHATRWSVCNTVLFFPPISEFMFALWHGN